MKYFAIFVFGILAVTAVMAQMNPGLPKYAPCYGDEDCTAMCNSKCIPFSTNGACYGNLCYCILLSPGLLQRHS